VNEQLVVTNVHPLASAAEIVAITTAISSLWPKPQPRRSTEVHRAWRFSRRRFFGTQRDRRRLY